jgi:hypothetical protein
LTQLARSARFRLPGIDQVGYAQLSVVETLYRRSMLKRWTRNSSLRAMAIPTARDRDTRRK